jgi:hypothetical protein
VNNVHPALMQPDERRAEAARLLADAILRLRARFMDEKRANTAG